MEIGKFMITADHFVVCEPDETVSTAITKMVKAKIGSILIKELDTVIGIVTNIDILEIIDSKATTGLEVKLKDIMSDKLITVSPSDQLNTALLTMEEKKVHHLLVEEDKKIVGFISSFDLIREKALDTKAFPWIRARPYY